MTYNDLFFLAKERGISIASLAKDIGMTPNGLKKSFETKKLPWEKIESLCELFGLTPNQLLGWPVDSHTGGGNYAANITGGNTQNSDTAILTLRDELREQRVQLKEKDRQISRLLDLLGKQGFSFVAAEEKAGYKKSEKKGNE